MEVLFYSNRARITECPKCGLSLKRSTRRRWIKCQKCKCHFYVWGTHSKHGRLKLNKPMPDPTFSNPYPKPPPGSTRHEVTGFVSHEDYFFLKQRLPMVVGLTDKIISTLYQKFINELRSIDAATPIEPGWFVGSDTHILISSVLNATSFSGRIIGQASPRDEQRGAGPVHQGDGGETKQRTDEEGELGPRGDSTGSKTQGKEKGQRRGRASAAGKSE